MKGTTLGHFRVLERLGAGAMGEVYLAEDTNLKRRIALKVLPPRFASSRERLERFQFEAEAIAALNHPNIVTVHSIEEAIDAKGQEVRFLTMELVEGTQLDEAIPGEGLDLQEFFGLALQMVEGVAAAHARGVIHRDIKPGNVMIADGRVKILDFGLAKLSDPVEPSTGDSDLPTAVATELGRVLGTPAYMAPEQATGQAVDARADVFALGAVLYEMLAGRRPFVGDSMAAVHAAILKSDPQPLSEVRPEMPAELAELVGRCLSKDADDRFDSAVELEAELRQLAEMHGPVSGARERMVRKRLLFPAAVLVVALAGLSVWQFLSGSRADRVRTETLPEIGRLLDEQKTFEAFHLALEARETIPDDPFVAEAIARSSKRPNVTSTPDGVEVFYQDYLAPGSDWRRLGVTPLESAELPYGFLRWRLVKDGYQTLELGTGSEPSTVEFELTPQNEAPTGMLRVPPGSYHFNVAEPIDVPGYFLDRFEVTNRQFQQFVDAGGYQSERYWNETFTQDGAELDRNTALALMVDSTGRPGPSTWSLGRFPEGEADHPVRGVSWYEAMAYAEFAGKSLPTLFHWRSAAPWSHRGEFLLLSNVEGAGPAPVGEFQGIGRFGHSDLAGNVNEWCSTAAPGGLRYLVGGSWLEPSYIFTHNWAREPLERKPDMGLRLATYDQPPRAELAREIGNFRHDFRENIPVSDEEFEFFRSLYAYDPLPLDSRIESTNDVNSHWRRETVSFTASYGGDRVIAHLFLPKSSSPPYQAVVYVPGITARFAQSIDDMATDPALFLPRSGRALVWPAYMGTLERGGGGPPTSGDRALRDRAVQAVNDLQRTVDYLRTRDDIGAERLGYLGLSSGSEYGPLYTAIETRFSALVYWAGGFDDLHMLQEPAELNPWNYAPRVEAPTLMINGSADYGIPVDTGQIPLFELLGTEPEHKQHILFDGGHIPSDWNQTYRETLNWLDRYLGPIAPQTAIP